MIASLLRIFLVTCSMISIVELKPALGKNGKGNHKAPAARDSSDIIEISLYVPFYFHDILVKNTYRYLGFKIVDNVVVQDYFLSETSPAFDTIEEDTKLFYEMKSRLTDQEPRYILYKYPKPRLHDHGGRVRYRKLAFIFWFPDNAEPEIKNRYASAKDKVLNAFDEEFTYPEYEANSFADLDYNTFIKTVTDPSDIHVIDIDFYVPSFPEDMLVRDFYRYAGFKIVDNVVVNDYYLSETPPAFDTIEEDAKLFYKMKSRLTDQEPRYILYKFPLPRLYARFGRGGYSGMAFIFWFPDNAEPEIKNLYASAKDKVLNAFDEGFTYPEYEANDFEDLDYKTFIETVTGFPMPKEYLDL